MNCDFAWRALAVGAAMFSPHLLATACSSVEGPAAAAQAASGTTSAGPGGGGSGGSGVAGTSSAVTTGPGGGGLEIDGGPDYEYDGPVYDGDMACAPPIRDTYEVTSCCEGVPCLGNCELHGGQWICTCYGAIGGCAEARLKCCSHLEA